MARVPEPALVDTNVLVYALFPAMPDHAASRALLDRTRAADANLWVAPQNLRCRGGEAGGTVEFDPMPDLRDVDPRELRVPPSRRQGADPTKLARQISLFGRSVLGMPPPWVYEGTDGVLILYNGVTQATRIAKLAPGTSIRVEVIGKLPRPFAGATKIGDLLP